MRRPAFWILLLLIPTAFLAGVLTGPRSGDGGGREVLYYVDPMNPSFRSPEPGIAPCGMALEPVYADAGGEERASLPPGAVGVRADRRQLIGVTTEEVRPRTLRHELRLFGTVAADETRRYQLSSITQGWVRWVSDATTGTYVKKGAVLAKYYAQEAYNPQQAYIYALNTLEQERKEGRAFVERGLPFERTVINTQQALLNVGMTQEQLDRIGKTREVELFVEIRAPADGFITARNVWLGQAFRPTSDLYTITDLSRVWVLADAFEGDARFLQPGVQAKVTLPTTGQEFQAVVSQVLPEFDATTRTLRVRLEADNPEFVLRTDMFVDVDLPVDLGPALIVPEEAVLDTGTRQVVFVEQRDGVFEPRKVRTGWRYAGQVEILSGIMEGEKVVTSGNFLIDSESRMRLASLDIRGTPGQCIICDMEIDRDLARAAGRTSIFEGRTWFFCSERCLHEFDRDPAGHVRGKPMDWSDGPEETGSEPPQGSAAMPGAAPPQSAEAMPKGHSMSSMPGMASDPEKSEDAGTAR